MGCDRMQRMTADALRRTPFNPGARAQRAARKPGPTHLSGRQPARSQPCAPRWARAYALLPPGHSPACRLADPGRPAPVAHTSSTLMRSHPSYALPQARGAHFGRLVDGKGLLDRRADGRTVRSDRPGCAGRCPVHGSGDSCRRHALPVMSPHSPALQPAPTRPPSMLPGHSSGIHALP